MPELPDEFALPDPLQGALHRMHEPPVVPPELDDRVLYSAKEAFVRRHKLRQWAKGAIAGISASAAVIALALWMARPGAQTPSAAPMVATAPPSPNDIDGDGRVDILDAYVVARTLSTHGPVDSRWDRNGDGKVDSKDVDQIAQAAVALPAATGGLVQ